MTTRTPTSEAGSFDLTTQPWIQLHLLDGSVVECSLREVFRLAPQARAVVGEISTMTFALTRLLLAILHRAVGGPANITQWSELWAATELPTAQIDTYLDHVADRFDLLHSVTPFYQVAGLRSDKDEVSGLEKLIADIPNGIPYFTTRSGRSLKVIGYAEAARWLVHAQAYEPSGIKTGAVGDPRVKGGRGYPIGTGWCGSIGGVMVEGTTLRETLLLNLIADSYSTPAADDLPVWERPPQTAVEESPAPRSVRGPLDAYTWQKSRIRLDFADGLITGVVLANGDRAKLVNQHAHEPMTAWRRSANQEKTLEIPLAYMPRVHSPARAMWRGIAALLPSRAANPRAAAGSDRLTPGVIAWIDALRNDGALDDRFVIRTHAFGIEYGTQSAVISEIIDDALSMQVALLGADAAALGEQVEQAVQSTDKLVWTLGTLAADVAEASGGDPEGPRQEAMTSAYAALDAPFRSWLAGLGPDRSRERTGTDPLLARADWDARAQSVVRGLARSVVESAPDASMVLRPGRTTCTPMAENSFRRRVATLYAAHGGSVATIGGRPR